MPRLSLYKPERGNDFHFLDKQIQEMFTVGGTDINVHKYLGARNPSSAESTSDQPRYDAVKETNIQDLLFLENRDRKYDPDVYTMRAVYNVQDIDFDLSQFGLFLSNDTLFMTIHINSSVKTLGRKIMSGDVIELPHLTDEYALNDYDVALKRFYVVEDVNRAAEGFSQTWYPHLYRLKLKQIYDTQEYKEILDLPASENSSNTLRDVLSTYEKEMQINRAVVAQAEQDAPKSGFDISHFYSIATNDDGSVALQTADETDLDASMINTTADEIADRPDREGYTGYLVGTGDAALKTKKYIKDKYFLMLLPDDLIISKNCSKDMIKIHRKYKSSVMASMKVKRDNVNRWGIYSIANKLDKLNFKISDVIEKPNTKDAPSNNAVIGRYILPKKIFDYLKNQKKGKGGEIHITDAIRKMISNKNLFIGHKFKGKYLDCGSMSGYIHSGIEISKL